MLLVGCQQKQSPNHQFKDYQKRLAKVLKVKPAFKKNDYATIAVPRKRDRMIVSSEESLPFFDFLTIENCPLKIRLANKNNQLGQHMQAGGGIFYELAIRYDISECIKYQKTDKQISTLKKMHTYKQHNELANFWQYTFASNWYGKFANTATQPIGWHDEDTLLAASQALKTLYDKMSLHTYSNEKSSSLKYEINQNIQVLETTEAFGKLILSMQLAKQQIELSTKLLRKTNKENVCNRVADGTYKPNKQLQYFNNVVINYFANNIQVYLARLSRQGNQLIQIHAKFLKKYKGLNALSNQSAKQAFRELVTFHGGVEQLQLDLKEAIKAHVKAVQYVQNMCDSSSIKYG